MCVRWGGLKRAGNWEEKCWNSAQSLEVTPSNVIPSLITEIGTRGRHQQTHTHKPCACSAVLNDVGGIVHKVEDVG